MATLAQLSENRIRSGLTAIMSGFAPGQPIPAQLVAGRDQALATLRKYVPDFKYDVRAADEQAREVDAWAQRNNAALSAIMQSPATELPQQLQLQMGSSRAQAFVLSSFTQAAAGLGPWTSGQVGKLAAAGGRVNETWARADAQERMQLFALIIKMDQDGALSTVFEPPGGTSGLGAPLPVWAIVLIVVAVAAAVVLTIYLWRRVSVNNRLMDDLCKKAYADGNNEVVKHCIDATKELQQIEPKALETGVEKVGQALVVAGGVYVALAVGVPWLSKQLAKKGRATS